MLLLVANVKPPVEFSAVLSVKLLSVVTDSEVNVAAPCDRVMAPAPLFTTVALPLVFRVKLGVVVLTLPMLPAVELRDNDVNPVSVPLPVMAPVPKVLRETTVPLIVFAPNPMAPLAAVVLKESAAAELSASVIVKLLLSETVRLAN